MAEQHRDRRADAGTSEHREGEGAQGAEHHAHGGADYAPDDATRAGHRSFENTSFAADQREQTEERERVARREFLDEAGEPPDPLEGRE